MLWYDRWLIQKHCSFDVDVIYQLEAYIIADGKHTLWWIHGNMTMIFACISLYVYCGC